MSVGGTLVKTAWKPFYLMRNIYQLQKPAQYHICSSLLQYKETDNKFDPDEIAILNKSALPKDSTESKVVVSEATDVLTPKAAQHYFSVSIFYDELVNKFVNCMMHGGKKSASQTVMRDTFERMKKIQLEKQRKSADKSTVEIDPLKIFHAAMDNAKPVLGTQTMKKKGKNFQVPYPLPDNRRRFLAIKWFLITARNRPGNDVPMSVKLSKEILDAYKNEGAVIHKKVDFHKKAEVHRAFAHYRWW